MRRAKRAFCLILLASVAPMALAGERGQVRAPLEARVDESGKVVRVQTMARIERPNAEAKAGSAEKCGGEALEEMAARSLVETIAKEENFDPAFVMAVVRAESSFRSDAVSPKGAIGLMQLEPETAARFGVDICDPADNVRGGVRFLRELNARYQNPLFVLAAYNAGEKALAEHGGVPPYLETVRFVAEVINEFYGWSSVVRKRGAGSLASRSNAKERAVRARSGAPDEHWRSGFVWNFE